MSKSKDVLKAVVMDKPAKLGKIVNDLLKVKISETYKKLNEKS